MNNEASPVIQLWSATAGARFDPGRTVATDVNWTVNAGEFWVVAGEQHSGKSDLLMLAAGLLPPVAGRCEVFGRDARELDETRIAERLRIGFVFEDGRLFHDLTLLQNIALPLQYHRNQPAEEVLRTLEPLLTRMELLPLVEKLSAELSRNWCKRAGLARALALEPEVLILDNPLHGLGATHRQWWLRFLDEIARERNLTVILATDDLRPWAGNDHYRFALLHEGLFLAAGHWPDLLKNHPHLARTLLAGADRETAQ